MALMAGLGQAATVAQLVGVDAGGLISAIMQAAATARQSKKECEQLARRVFMIAELLPHLQDPEVTRRPEVRRPLEGLGDTLREAHELVMSCQGRSAAYRLVTAGRLADRFRDVKSRIDSYLLVFPFISHIDITRRLDRIHNILLPNEAGMPSAGSQPESQPAAEVAQEQLVASHGDGPLTVIRQWGLGKWWRCPQKLFTMAELSAATCNFRVDTVIGEGVCGKVYKGKLPDRREVAIKSTEAYWSMERVSRNEINILSRLRHRHVIRLIGWSVQEEKHCLLSSPKKEEDLMLVYEYMNNGSLYEHLHSESSSSPVKTSWKTRLEILLGVSRGIAYLHCSAVPPIIHRDVKSSNILLDDSWAPRVVDFGLSVTYDDADENEFPVVGTFGYIDPEYCRTRHVKPSSDVYNLGVVMLEVLSGKKAHFFDECVIVGEYSRSRKVLSIWGLELIEAGKLDELLDKRPGVPEPTLRQLEAAELVAQKAARCLRLQGKDRPAVSDVVGNLERALELVSRGD